MNNRGQSLLEVIVAVAIFAMVASAMITLATGGFTSLNQGGEQTMAEAMAQEGAEGVRAIRDRAWNELIFATSSVATSSGSWQLSGEGTTQNIDDYIRTISFANVCRDQGNKITNCPGSYIDLYSKLLKVIVEWSPRAGVTNTVSQVGYLTNWDSLKWVQKDWSGGAGQSIWFSNNKYDSDDGHINASSTGEVKLKTYTNVGCGTKSWHFDNVDDYVYNAAKILVTSSLTSLVDTGNSDTGPIYASDRPSINPILSYSVPTSSIGVWASIQETATKNGGEIYYQLSDDDGVTWQYWNGSAWALAGADKYNTSSIINTNLGSFPTTTGKILFKAFLTSDGAQSVSLDEVKITCNKNYNWPFTVSSSYTYDPAKIIISGGSASLKDQGGGGSCSGTAAACNLFSSTSSCQTQSTCAWSSGWSGKNVNQGFDAGLANWSPGSWGTQLATYSLAASGGNPYSFAKIVFPSTKNRLSGAYFAQAFTVSSTISSAVVSFDSIVSQYTGPADSLKFYVSIDTSAGSPNIAKAVWSSANQTGVTGWTANNNINVASKITGARTYYLKIYVYLDYNNGGANQTYTVGFDNIKLNWTKNGLCSGTVKACNALIGQTVCGNQAGCIWNSVALYPIDKPTILPASSLIVATSTLDTWTTFLETANKNGGEIYYQLSADDGTTWQYWNGTVWTLAGANKYNTSSIINIYLGSFPTTTGKILFKAFLASNGLQLVQLDNVRLGWRESEGFTFFENFGYFISSAFNMLKTAAVQILEWEQNLSGCPTCQIKFQLRVAPNKRGVPGVWSNWYGADGVDTYYTNALGTLLSTALNWQQWVQYRVELSGDGAGTPVLQEVRVDYK